MDGSGFSEKRSETSEFSSEARRASGGPMSSVATAQTLTREVGELLAPNGGWQQRISAVHRELTSEQRPWKLDLRWSRVKSWFYGEARRVDYHEVLALKELKAIEEAKREHRQFIARTNWLKAALAEKGQVLSGEELALLARLEGRSADLASLADQGTGGAIRRMVGTRAGGDAR